MKRLAFYASITTRYQNQDPEHWGKLFLSTFLAAAILFVIVIMAHAQTPCPAIIAIAQSQIGHGELLGNNRGPHIKEYLNGKEGLPWCAGFVSYCARESGLDIKYTLKAKDFLKLGKTVKYPQPGDIIVFSRNGGGHVGIIEKTEGGAITVIEGNSGKYPSKVKRVIYKSKPRNLLAYVRLQNARQ